MSQSEGVSGVQQVAAAVGRYRWVICALLFFGVTKNYMDRQVLGVLKGTLQAELHWNEIDYGNLVFAFQCTYAIGIVIMGRFMDRVGTRIGYTLAMIFWSLASMATAGAGSLTSFFFARGALGLGESGVFPASIKAVAEWFPKKERALATGIFNAGTNVGAVLTPLIIPWITVHWGWRSAFIVTGALGFVWLALWLTMYREPEEHPKVSAGELAYIRSDPQDQPQKLKWLNLLTHRQTWAFVLGKMLTDPIWWFYLFWVPGFLQTKYHLTLSQIAAPVMVIYIVADFGSVGGGWLPTLLIKHGASINAGRKLAMLICALCVVPVVLASDLANMWIAVGLIAVAASAHQGFSANLFTLTSDMFPNRAVGSVAGLGGMSGAIGGMVIAKIVGYVLQWTGSYRIPFFMAGAAYLTALALVQLLAPNLEPARLPEAEV